MSAPSQDTRLTKLESAVTTVATQLGEFIKDNKSNQDLLWAAVKEQGNQHSQAIKEQGIQLQMAVEKLSAKGQISWTAICTTIAVLVTMIGAGAKVSHMLMESRMQQVEKVEDVRTRYMEKELEHLRKP